MEVSPDSQHTATPSDMPLADDLVGFATPDDDGMTRSTVSNLSKLTKAEAAKSAPFDDSPADPHFPPEDPAKRGCLAPLFQFMEMVVPYGGLVANIFSYGSVTLGGGIISVASAFQTSGIIMAIIYLVVINIITIYTISLMGIAIEKTGFRDYESMARGLFGRGWDYFVGFIVWLSCFGTAIGYISTVSSLLTPLLQNGDHGSEFLRSDACNKILTTVIWLCAMVPVVLPKHINSIRYVSAFGVIMVLYFVCTIVVHSCQNGLSKGMRGEMVYFTTGNQAIYGLSIFIFSFLSHCITYRVYLEQRPRPSVKRLTIGAGTAMTVCMVFYIIVGIFGYFDFADDLHSSILENFDPLHQPYMMVAYIGLFIKVCAAYAMNMMPCRDFVYYCMKWDLETVAYWKHFLTVGIMSIVVLIAGLFIPSINTAFGLVGSICGGFISFIFPVLFWMYCGNWSLRTVGFLNWAFCYFIIAGGVVAIVFGTIATIDAEFISK